MKSLGKQILWSEWDDLEVPAGMRTLSPATAPLDQMDEKILSEITFYVAPYLGGRKGLAYANRMSSLSVLQLLTAGFDDAMDYVRPEITLCNGRGIHDASTAELAVGLTIASLRGIPDFVRNQEKGEWKPGRYKSINDRKIGIVGFGAIGKNIARILSGFDVDVVAFSQSGRDGAIKMTDFDAHLPTLDVVILILPLNDSSYHLFDERRFSLMKDGALLVNVARGAVVDTDALVAALHTGKITAAVDVTDPEPLPADHPLWGAPGILIAPHVGGNSSAFEPRARKLIEQQLNRLAEGIELENIIVRATR
ncbi:MAG: 2-hydroxyacid dehydrogenase [Actinobacteria bacterium]|nr:2-hydroxyacid dehydrogenase [Actinomycetota bacterium]